MVKRAGLNRIFGGKRYTIERGYPTKDKAVKFAKSLRGKGIKARVVRADKHGQEAHGVHWEVFVR